MSQQVLSRVCCERWRHRKWVCILTERMSVLPYTTKAARNPMNAPGDPSEMTEFKSLSRVSLRWPLKSVFLCLSANSASSSRVLLKVDPTSRAMIARSDVWAMRST